MLYFSASAQSPTHLPCVGSSRLGNGMNPTFRSAEQIAPTATQRWSDQKGQRLVT